MSIKRMLFACLLLVGCCFAQLSPNQVTLGPLADPTKCVIAPTSTATFCITTTGKILVSFSGSPLVDINAAGTSPVQSVFNRTGAVVAAQNDYQFNQIGGKATLAQLPAIGFSDLQGTLNIAQLPAINFSNLVGKLTPAQMPATMTCSVTGTLTPGADTLTFTGCQ